MNKKKFVFLRHEVRESCIQRKWSVTAKWD